MIFLYDRDDNSEGFRYLRIFFCYIFKIILRTCVELFFELSIDDIFIYNIRSKFFIKIQHYFKFLLMVFFIFLN